MKNLLKKILPWIKRLDVIGAYKRFPDMEQVIYPDIMKPLVRRSEDISLQMKDLERELIRIGINPFHKRNRGS
jgi:hypothetical protein